MKALNAVLTFFGVLFQRLVSIDWKTAGVETGLFFGSISVIVADVKSKNYAGIWNAIQDPTLSTAIAFLMASFRMIVSSNVKAIANPDPRMAHITGDGSHPVNVPLPVKPDVTSATSPIAVSSMAAAPMAGVPMADVPIAVSTVSSLVP